MACPCPLPATLFSSAIGSRAYSGLGPTGVAGALRKVLQRKPLQSLIFSASQHLQHLQQPSASRRHMRPWRVASGRDHARGFGGVASVASVANSKCIYKSMVCAATPAATPAPAARQPVAAPPCSIGSAAPKAIKNARLFNGLGSAGRVGAETGRFGVFGARAPAAWRAASCAGSAARRGLDQAQTGRNGHRSPVQLPPVAADREQYQRLAPSRRLTVSANRGVASAETGPPGLAPTRPPGFGRPPSSAARLAAPAAASPVFPAGNGENADRSSSGARVSGAWGSSAAISAAQRSSGSGAFHHG